MSTMFRGSFALLGMILRAPENEGGGGGGGGGGNPPPASPNPPADPNAPPPAKPDPNAAPNAPPATPPAGQAYFPAGLSDNYKGASDRETIDKMAQGLETYRKKAGDVPAEATGYRDFGEIKPEVKPYFDTLEGDTIFDQLAQRAHARKMSKGDFQAVVKDFMELAAEGNLLEPPIDAKAEIAALVPEGSKHLPEAEQRAAVDKRMNGNIAWIESLKAKGLEPESAEYMTLMLTDSAKGHKALEWFRGRIEGTHRAGPGGGTGDGGAGGNARIAQIKAELNEPKHIPGKAGFDKASYDALMSELQKLA